MYLWYYSKVRGVGKLVIGKDTKAFLLQHPGYNQVVREIEALLSTKWCAYLITTDDFEMLVIAVAGVTTELSIQLSKIVEKTTYEERKLLVLLQLEDCEIVELEKNDSMELRMEKVRGPDANL